VLLAEDEPAVRTLAAQVLRDLGYTVLEASNGDEALQIAQARRETIDLLLTDMVMPRMGGRALVERLMALRPDIIVVLMSGYTNSATVHEHTPLRGVTFLQKPFLPATLAHKVREALDARRDG
jgi:two-component system cell cycle sensor histidine kinase/response regulator CckA